MWAAISCYPLDEQMISITRLFSAALALLSLSLVGFAQEPVRGKLYTKTIGETVHVVVEMRVQMNWHIYHADLGPPDAVGKPTLVELSGGDLLFGEVEFPEPERHDEPALGTWAYVHHGKVLIRAPRVKDRAARAAGLLKEHGEALIPLQFGEGELQVEGEPDAPIGPSYQQDGAPAQNQNTPTSTDPALGDGADAGALRGADRGAPAVG